MITAIQANELMPEHPSRKPGYFNGSGEISQEIKSAAKAGYQGLCLRVEPTDELLKELVSSGYRIMGIESRKDGVFILIAWPPLSIKTHNKNGDKAYILQRDIVIPAGTRFDNFTRQAKDGGYVEAVVGFGQNCVEFFRIQDVEEILRHEPSFFKEEK